MPLYIENDSPLDVVGLTDDDGDVVADATVTAAILRSGTEIWTGTLAPIAGSPGDYTVLLPDPLPEGASLTLGEIVTVRYKADAGSLNATWYQEERVRQRRP